MEYTTISMAFFYLVEVAMIYKFKEYKEKPLLVNHLNLGGKNNSGGSIEVTSKYLLRDTKPWIPVMAEVHFSRINHKIWKQELSKIKAGGITTVATYFFWIYHEEHEGEISFDGDLNIREFALLCKEVGLDLVLRVGPWAHGECRNGGLPDWLLKKDFKLRDSNPGYMSYVKKWYSAIADQVEGLYYKDGGPIIAVQLENEYVDNAKHLADLKELAISCGLIVPLYTVTGWNSAYGAKIPVDEVLPLFGGYCDAPWDKKLTKLPPSCHYFFNQMRNDSAIGEDLMAAQVTDGWQLPYDNYPFATCEIGGGMQVTHHRRPFVQPMDIYAIAVVKLGDGNNLPGYYMYRGGTNKIGKDSTLQESKATNYPNDYSCLSYDFQAPIGEFGYVRESYGMLNILHLFLEDFGSDFATLDAVDSLCTVDRNDTTSLRYGMRCDKDHGYVFINHYQRQDRLEDVKDVVISTGSVTFDAFDVTEQIAFFMPFNMTLDNGAVIVSATAQPICKENGTFYFMAIPGIEPKFNWKDDKRGDIRILSFDEARYLRRLNGKLYLSKGCNLYLLDGQIRVAKEISTSPKPCTNTMYNVSYELVDALPYSIPDDFMYELQIDDVGQGQRNLTIYKLDSYDDSSCITIDMQYDVAIIFADGLPVADNFYYGAPWSVSTSLLKNHECYVVMSEMRDDFYREF